MLEERVLLTSIVWDGDAGDNNWTTPTNWEGDELPTDVHDVIVGPAFAGEIIRIGKASVHIKSLQSEAMIHADAGVSGAAASLRIDADSSIAGLIADNGAELFQGPSSNARLDIHGPLDWISDARGARIGPGVEEIHVFGNITINGDGTKSLSTRLHNYGTGSVFLGGDVRSSQLLHNHGTFMTRTNADFGGTAGTLGRFYNAPGATLIHDAVGSGDDYMYFHRLDNDGSVEIVRGKLRTGFTEPGEGTFNVPAGTEIQLGPGTLSASSVIDMDGTLIASDNLNYEGTVQGNGTIVGRVAPNGANFRPGGDGAGLLTIDGQFLPIAGNLEIHLGGTAPGTEHDQIVVTDNANLRGNLGNYHLNVSLVDGHTPSAGDSYTILSGDASGSFTTTNLPTLSGDQVWDVTFGSEGVVLKVLINNNLSPTVTSAPTTAASEGQLYSYDVEAIDPNAGDMLTFSLEASPTGMTIDPSTGLIEWTPTAAQVGTNAVTVRVTDAGGLFDTQSFSIEVSANDAPTITSVPGTTATADQLYTYDAEAIDPDVGDTLTFELNAGPSGMTIDSSSGLVQWTPSESQVGGHAATLRVTDSGGLFDTQNFSITVSPVAPAPEVVYVNDDFMESDGTVIDDADPNTAGDQTATIGIDAFDTIQEGVVAVSAGGTVFITDTTSDPAIYNEAVTINKDATISGTSGDPANHRLTNPAGDAVTITNAATNVSLENLRITGSGDDGVDADGVSGTLSLTNVELTDHLGDGLALANVGSVVTTNVSASGNVRGLYIVDSVSLSDTDGTFSGNADGGIFIADIARDVTLTRTTADDNDSNADSVGDGFHADSIGGGLLVRGGRFRDTGGADDHQQRGVFAIVAEDVTIENAIGQSVEITGNEMRALFVQTNDTVSMTGGNYSHNFGGILLEASRAIQLTNVAIDGNRLSGLDVINAESLTVDGGSSFSNNGIHGIFIRGFLETVDVRNSVVNGNASGGFVKLANTPIGDVTISDSTFSNNDSNRNGIGIGIFLGDAALVTLSNVTASGNIRGVFIPEADSFSDTDGTHSGNADGGIVLEDIAGDVTLIRTTADNNDANDDNQGGGFNAAIGGNLVMQGGRFGTTGEADSRQSFGVDVDVVGDVTIEEAAGQPAVATGNRQSGLGIQTGGNVSISGGDFSDNFVGIHVSSSSPQPVPQVAISNVTVDRNDLENNTGAGLLLNTTASLIVDGQNSFSNNGIGMFLLDVASIEIHGSTVDDNDDDGLRVPFSFATGDIVVSDSTFNNNDADGNEFGDGIAVRNVEDLALSDVTANGNIRGVFITRADSFRDTDGTFSGNADGGIVLEDIAGSVTLVRTTLQDNDSDFDGDGDGLRAARIVNSRAIGSNLLIQGATIGTSNPGVTHQRNGVKFEGALRATFEDAAGQGMRVTGNDDGGIEIADVTDVRFTNGDYSNNGVDGLDLFDISGNLQLTDVAAENNAEKGLQIEQSRSVTVNGGTYSGNNDDGIDASQILSLSVDDVTLDGNGDDGIDLENSGSTRLSGVTSSGNGDFGLLVSGVSLLSLADVSLTGNGGGGSIDFASSVNLDTGTAGTVDVLELNTPAIGGEGRLQLTRDSIPQDVIEYNGVGFLDIDFFAEDDAVTLSPHSGTRILLDGGEPTKVPNGDSLNYLTPMGETANVIPIPADPQGDAGTIVTSNFADVVYDDFESVSLSGSIIVNGTGQDDLLLITAASTDTGAYQLVTNGVAGPAFQLANATEFTFNGLDGNDVLRIDNQFAGVFHPPGGVFYDGGAGSDTLEILNGTAASVMHSFVNQSAGSVFYNGEPTVAISYTNLEPIIDTVSATDRMFDFTGAEETITLSDDGDTGDGESFIDSTLSESVIFTNPTGSLTINTEAMGGGGADTLNIEGLDSTFDANLTVNAGRDDLVNFLTNATGLGTGNLNVSAMTINVDEEVSTSGAGAVDLTASRNIVVSSGGLTTVIGNLSLDANASGLTAEAFHGIDVSGGHITSTSGAIALVGQGGLDGSGVSMNDNAVVRSTGSGAHAAAIMIDGTSTGAGHGVRLLSGSQVSSVDGDVLITGNSSGIDGVNIFLATVASTGQGDITIDGQSTGRRDGVNVRNRSRIRSHNGNVRITGESANQDGVDVSVLSVVSASNSGNVTIDGTGAFYGVTASIDAKVSTVDGDIHVTGGSSHLDGVRISEAQVSSVGSGAVTIDGTSTGVASGVRIVRGGTQVTSVDGDVRITGSSSGDNGVFDYGVLISLAAQVSAAGSGAMTIDGTSTGVAGGVLIDRVGTQVTSEDGNIRIVGKTSGSHGVRIIRGAAVSSAASGTDAPSIMIDGTSTGTGYGVRLVGRSQVNSVDGEVQIAGTSSGLDGVNIAAATVASTGQGDIAIHGQSTGSILDGVRVTSDAQVTSQDGSVRISGESTNQDGVEVSGRSVVSAFSSGNVILDGTGANRGVFIASIGTQVSTLDGDVRITGNATRDAGVRISAQVHAAGSGEIVVDGISTGNGESVLIQDDLTAVTSMDGAITITAIDTPGGGDNLRVGAGTSIQSANADVLLQAGDDLILEESSLVAAPNSSIVAVGDSGDSDPAMGSRIVLSGTLIAGGDAGGVSVNTGPDDDSILINPAADSSVNLISAMTGDANDSLFASPLGSTDLLVDLGAGHDIAIGGAGNDILLGGAGNDRLIGGAGRNVLIGGVGIDTLIGGLVGGSILLGGTTDFDDDAHALNLVLAEWSSSQSLSERVRNLRRGEGEILAGTGVKLDTRGSDRTVFDDDEPDVLIGTRFGHDWFFAKLSGNKANRDRIQGPTLFDELDRL